MHGRWDQVLAEASKLKLPLEKLMKLYEIIIQEMLELGEIETAQALINDGLKQNGLYSEFPEKCMRLEYLSKRSKLDIKEIYTDKLSKEKRRSTISEAILAEVGTAPSSRLLYLLGQSLKYQELQGDIQPNIKLNIFTGHIPPPEDEVDVPTLVVEKKVKYGEEYRVECVTFSNQGKYMATGSVDGIIEIYDPVSCDIDKNLVYQNEENYLMHKDPILSMVFSDDDELLATADKKGIIKVWRVQSGKLLKKIDGAMQSNVTSLIFGKEYSHLIGASQEIKVIGLKSGKSLKEFRGHTSYVTQLLINDNSTRLISGSKDGTIRFWDYTTTECLQNFSPPSDSIGVELDIYNIVDLTQKGSGQEPSFLVCNKSDTLNIINWHCQMLKSYSNDKKEDFVGTTVSSHKGLFYAATISNYIYIFSHKSGKMDQCFKLFEDNDEILGIQHHPLRNILCVFTIKGVVYFLKP
ncbi:WD40-repeat-containing domain [Pseudocohnilembus persalinus]|uniref:WD40-repeat-containing domain n=1 Tax=Pseudocohnilembus persalinus TaxID=266149 RepID=A0A0V0QVU2_PSEPJ|nr:WD40-repeat-containing domain [Pseudocohnilembus persalinus]|eukprot:KRX06056.1 WD40-repeat-containing domain [Pseudocohnilembus persalinus]